MSAEVNQKLTCYHCGEQCDEAHEFQNKTFCCFGCKTVFEILHTNNLCEYYHLYDAPGSAIKPVDEDLAYLDEPGIRSKVVQYDIQHAARVDLFIPAIHCVSCIWLLENLQKLMEGIVRSRVNFACKTVSIDFNSEKIRLSSIAQLLASLGYSPKITLDQPKGKTLFADQLLLKLAVAGFCFGNVMLFSFPEYLGLDHADHQLKRVFSWLNVLLSIPVFVFSGSEYLRSAWQSLKQHTINIDVPIAIGLVVLFFRSFADIVTNTGPGYLDSFTGLVFFLLIGRWFQSKTYASMAFDRDFKSYFPLAVNRKQEGEWRSCLIHELRAADIIQVRNGEIIPADSALLDDLVQIDYSFVTGESLPVILKRGEVVYAGGRLIGKPVSLCVQKVTNQSYLTSLWNHEVFQKNDSSRFQSLIDRVAKAFTWSVLALALATALFWYYYDTSMMWLVVTSVLMVACPCALALASPFTFGNMLRVFGRHGLYLKNAQVVERMANVNAIVFDKTGTLTHGNTPVVDFVGTLSKQERSWIKILTGYSTHPLSNIVHKCIGGAQIEEVDEVKEYYELPGQGIMGRVSGHVIKIGSAPFTNAALGSGLKQTIVGVSINDKSCGYFTMRIQVRDNIKDMLSRLSGKCTALLSGDNASDRARFSSIFPSTTQLLFNQSPHDKLNYIRSLQDDNKKVLMVGDGLNDAGALKQSDVGIAVSDHAGFFVPACDGILDGSKVSSIDRFLELAKSATRIVRVAFVISFAYNILALSFAVSGYLTPIIAAILMPVSSISVVVFTTIAVNFVSNRKLDSAWR
jgi:P-type Cu+ transporter